MIEDARLNTEFEIAWEKLRMPDDEEEDDDTYPEYDEPKAQLLQFSTANQSPFYQLKKFNFWTGHTNFKINKGIVLIIDSVLGVESIDIVSPYRFHISVGLRFKEQEVKMNINTAVIDFLQANEKKRPYEFDN